MGWNEGYRIMEETVISVYNTGKLTKELLDAIMRPYYDTDIDSGGSQNLRSKDGLDVEQIVCKVMEPERYEEIGSFPDSMPDYVQHSEKGYFTSDLELYVYETWQEAVKNKRENDFYDSWYGITRKNWKFW